MYYSSTKVKVNLYYLITMQKLTRPVFMYIFILLGLVLIIFKYKLSLIIGTESSFIFAFGVFAISFSLGLLFFKYLTDGTEQERPPVVTKRQKIETLQKEEPEKLTKAVPEKLKNNKKVNAKLKTEKSKKLVIESTEKKEVVKKTEKQEFNHNFKIKKTEVVKLLSDLKTEFEKEKLIYKQAKTNTGYLLFTGFLVLAFAASFYLLKYDSLTFSIKLLLGVFSLILFIVIYFLFSSKAKAKNKLNLVDEKQNNLEQTAKRFRIISANNSDALKSTLNNLMPETKDYIYKKLQKK